MHGKHLEIFWHCPNNIERNVGKHCSYLKSLALLHCSCLFFLPFKYMKLYETIKTYRTLMSFCTFPIFLSGSKMCFKKLLGTCLAISVFRQLSHGKFSAYHSKARERRVYHCSKSTCTRKTKHYGAKPWRQRVGIQLPASFFLKYLASW